MDSEENLAAAVSVHILGNKKKERKEIDVACG